MLLAACSAAHAQTPSASTPPPQQGGSAAVYRCPGPPVLYTDALTVKEANERGCKLIEGTPITIVQMPKARPAPPANAGASRPGDSKVDPTAQRQRDSDARRILEGELKREEDKLATLKREYNNGEPERQGNERNYQTYLDRVAGLKASITRSESDVAALKRELAKLQ
ncbi:hypothetical protein HLB44_15060 [Aquincola sp. S2]|uniref:DUF4124 domain-containing protein n=2 Tax=Pseudaquabacterium terrae TaxID=2732868 RepID=A0ABX2EIB3_9BURK|nr:hypothetical protein [Aquabacterium terrae]